MTGSSTAASIVVPTFQEAPNIKMLVERVFAATASVGREVELLLVDDNSRDGTAAIVDALQHKYPVRLTVRSHERGLSSAVLTGFAEARYDRFVVLDADLQHPPEMIPALLDRLDDGDHDFVVGTRYAGGSIEQDWPMRRRLVSRLATYLARPLMPVSDPMSGFFALRRETWERASSLDPIGYKIGLELYVKGGCRNPAEVPIRFGIRAAGESKLNLAEQVRYLRHLYRLYRFAFPRGFRIGVAIVLLAVLAAVTWLIRRVP